jgi:hypothetical protein
LKILVELLQKIYNEHGPKGLVWILISFFVIGIVWHLDDILPIIFSG